MYQILFIHCDLHDGNILMSDNYEAYIIDLGLCKPINDSLQAENETNYGVLPYMAPEILKNDPYTSARDIYSFSMIMWEFTSGVPPFSNKVYDNCQLILDICNGERPEIIKGTPKCYIDLMKKCWDGKPENRPTIVSLEHIITQWFRSVSKYYELNEENDEHFAYMDDDILQFRSDIEEFVEANKSLLSQEQTNTYIEQSRPQLSNTSRSF
ncbi:kinase-like domain-containing protein [Rhizophagus irregularis DAOM 181602=DAOM 197198]|uniref:Kinase-like domain-containing protein n=3 Tax=Rhizophagus irregularis TaxID=588596 RepID=A0A2H5R8X7_RHIID|nr:kinase-like domain-containing protein [Rhizophagus irregularis DAOM 181602=DAOM 197198]POG73713.1 kinase-like domain-containing protein [Rhizophagus irregularis DAOM 181602=DAOM 197198]|eukprot:XP_025180579.1 kinase-like domain-containing protein [Rhizophagus irregularis DAOM 181602=DAOM 197198]